jgi:serine/threonine protein kinase
MSLTPHQAKQLADELLDGPDTAPSAADASPAPESIGNYRILRRIASGGMGTVYEAEQQHPHRTVALKVMKRGITSRSALRRFEYEAEVLGRLRHPGIAQIYEAGTHDDGSGGVPFFAMEYVPNARNILDYADAENLSVRDRLRLFAAVCDAVHHGHQRGVIHRDLKPGNILVDETGLLKVIDFGVARATDTDVALTTIQTGVGELLGTLQYMSPEQCDADPQELDTRTDVYSLGVVLYELLCGKPPYDLSRTPIPKATRRIQEDAPLQPSTIRKTLRGDIESITLKALEKERERRYQSAADFGQDIRRCLIGEPTEARPPTTWTRWARWMGRHPIAATVAACVMIAVTSLVLTFGSVLWFRLRPYQVERSADGREARLISVAGRRLHTWRSDWERGIRDAKLLEHPSGRKLALIAFSQRHLDEWQGALCAFDVGCDRDVPIWQSRVTEEEIIDDFQSTGHLARGFGPAWIEAIDLFDDPPGPEIITSYHHAPSSAAVIRILDLEGRLLYEFWHDGGVHRPYWMYSAGQLVFVGLNSEVYWDRRGYPNITEAHPTVVFAVRPQLGHRGSTWTTPTPGGSTATLAWYRCLLPAESSDFFGGERQVSVPPPGHDPGRLVQLGVYLEKSRRKGGILLLIDETGTETARRTGDGWKRNPDAPPLTMFSLGDLPPILPDTD